MKVSRQSLGGGLVSEHRWRSRVRVWRKQFMLSLHVKSDFIAVPVYIEDVAHPLYRLRVRRRRPRPPFFSKPAAGRAAYLYPF